jgi:hypothetical protein
MLAAPFDFAVTLPSCGSNYFKIKLLGLKVPLLHQNQAHRLCSMQPRFIDILILEKLNWYDMHF